MVCGSRRPRHRCMCRCGDGHKEHISPFTAISCTLRTFYVRKDSVQERKGLHTPYDAPLMRVLLVSEATALLLSPTCVKDTISSPEIRDFANLCLLDTALLTDGEAFPGLCPSTPPFFLSLGMPVTRDQKDLSERLHVYFETCESFGNKVPESDQTSHVFCNSRQAQSSARRSYIKWKR